jgi:hypothetical protein
LGREGTGASRAAGHVRQGQRLELFSYPLADVSPDAKQDALALMVTGTVFMRLSKVTGHNRAVYGRDDLGQGDLLRGASEDIAPTDSSFGLDEAGTF